MQCLLMDVLMDVDHRVGLDLVPWSIRTKLYLVVRCGGSEKLTENSEFLIITQPRLDLWYKEDLRVVILACSKLPFASACRPCGVPGAHGDDAHIPGSNRTPVSHI